LNAINKNQRFFLFLLSILISNIVFVSISTIKDNADHLYHQKGNNAQSNTSLGLIVIDPLLSIATLLGILSHSLLANLTFIIATFDVAMSMTIG
jgi:hypothetical protein